MEISKGEKKREAQKKIVLALVRFVLSTFLGFGQSYIGDIRSISPRTRENGGTEREAQGSGRDMSCSRKLFLDERKSVFRDVRMQSCLALRFLVKRENGIRPRLACMRTSPKTDFRGHDISQGLDWEPPSLSPRFFLPRTR